MFVALDKELKFGVSRQLLLDTYERMGCIVGGEAKQEFLSSSGYQTKR